MTEEDDHLAAEYAIGLLDGEALLAARGRAMHDPAFAQAVARWEAHFAPLLDDVPPQAPDPSVWDRIERGLEGGEPSATVVKLEQRLRRWQSAAGLAAAAAVVLALLSVRPDFLPGNAPPTADAPLPVLAGSIPIENTPLRLAVTYLPERRELLVSASGIAADGVHDHELWLVPDQGTPLSLGLVEAGSERGVALDPAISRQIGPGAKLALTREPLGGKPADRDAGPVVGQGTLSKI